MSDSLMKPCPCCGQQESVKIMKASEDESFDASNDDTYAIICDFTDGGCGCCGGHRLTLDEAIEVWNRRAPDQQPAAAPVSGDVALPEPVVAIESIKLAYEREFLQDWLSAAAEPCGRECCGHGVGGECCGDADPVFLSQSEFLTAMQERLKEVTALLSSQPFSMQIDVALPELPVLPTPALEFKMWDAFGGNQMHDYARTYGQQCSDAALERAAKAIDEFADKHLTGDDLKWALALIDVVRALKGGAA